jgi:hypothetical protein
MEEKMGEVIPFHRPQKRRDHDVATAVLFWTFFWPAWPMFLGLRIIGALEHDK